MTTTFLSHIKEEHAVKKILLLAVVTVALIALTAVPAFAEAQGYNDSGEYTRDNGYFSGPHGGYTTTTNKCAVCHSTHYAEGSFMLLRANSREAACDYCHGGGGGSSINIQMDNAYKTMTEDFDFADGVVDVANTPEGGYGTGHTLGLHRHGAHRHQAGLPGGGRLRVLRLPQPARQLGAHHGRHGLTRAARSAPTTSSSRWISRRTSATRPTAS
jgi:hypothetical protein